MRIVRRGLAPTALRMRSASIIAAEPVALSVAPVPDATESKCAPSSTTSSLSAGIGAGHLRDDVEAVARRFVVELRLDVQLDLDRHAFVEDADQAVVVLDGERDRRQRPCRRRRRASRRRSGRSCRRRAAAAPRQVAAAGRRVRVAAAVEERDDAFGFVELPGASAGSSRRRRGRRPRHGRRARRAGPARRDRSLLLRGPCRSSCRMNGPSSMRTARAGCVRTILPFSVPRYFSKSASVVGLHAHDVGDDRALGARRPRSGKADERLDLRLDQVRAEANERPALAERKRFEMRRWRAPTR